MKDFEVTGPLAPAFNRLQTLRELPAGWDEDNEYAHVITNESIEAAWTLVVFSADNNKELPDIFPLEDGGVQIEWSSAEQVTSVEITPAGDEFQLFDLSPVAGDAITSIEDATLEDAKNFILHAIDTKDA